ncbi:WcbI family polysaccharide biosynthesis putative acetyltransferase [Nocardioides zeae]|uniref:WcbI family polysaccharide biosynthesis putative acetyltransferase n=1 Tax=Nocardioides imazamoxiresistens TaxID=3231893 RepID=A0ABU3Q1Z2_9ACTN|nr:WcbI family polysaccharide biosynthesis putative acetyltransferase [Nocardioides zeae]MDT9595065.1 WcbI family polysaccharide biosynthesis putative acetyltransferase [Nocardioides zeae]
MSRSEAEQRHYAVFHELSLPPAAAAAEDAVEPIDPALPLLVVMGNCQAESLRLLLRGADLRSVRVPPVHELDAEDVPRLQRLLARTDLFVSQPVGAGYRGLPLGTDELRAHLPRSARTALVTPIRYHGLHPWHVVAHPPGLVDPDPPLVAYHDLRTLTGRREPPPDGAVAEVGRRSVAELQRREALHGSVVVSDLFAAPRPALMRTVNHPGNTVLAPVAARLREALGLDPAPPGVERPLLDAVHAPVEEPVVRAWGLDDAPSTDWRVRGEAVPDARVVETHHEFYRRRPDVADLLRTRYAELADLLGLGS